MKRKTKKKSRLKIPTRYYFYSIGIFCLIIFLFFFSIWIGLFGRMPSIKELNHIQHHLASDIYASGGEILGRYYLQNRTNTSIDDIPDNFIKALIATEDERFFEHRGIDKRSLFRVLVKTIILQNERAGGGSTLTQQLAKNLYPRKKYWKLGLAVNKIQEMIIARRLEKVYTKKQILELYLNTVSFGENTYGIETASERFFHKKPAKLRIEESAVLVGLLKATHYYNPKENEANALRRRNIVLCQMVRNEYLTKEEADSLKNLPLQLKYIKITADEGPAPYFREFLRMELLDILKRVENSTGKKYNLYTDGLRIYTTINSQLQAYAESAVKKQMKELQVLFSKEWSRVKGWEKNKYVLDQLITSSTRYKRLEKKGLSHDEIMAALSKPVYTKIYTPNGEEIKSISPIDSIKNQLAILHSGLLAIEAKTGYVLAWVGGIDHRFFKYNHVTSKRQVGSTFKPFVYATALERGKDPCTYYPNDSIVYAKYDNWVPRNADRKYGGYYTMKGGLTQSVNTVSVQVLMDAGIKDVIDLAHKAGIESELPEVPSLALGTAEISLLELGEGYTIFANKGKRVSTVYLRRIEDKQGNIIYETKAEIEKSQVISEQTAQTINYMLMNVVNNGTAGALRTRYGLNAQLAGKTGTTHQQSDGWYMGYSPDIIVGVWVGGDLPIIRFQSLYYGQGSSTALPIYGNFMKSFYTDPLYRFAGQSSFQISDSVKALFACEDYLDYDPNEFNKTLKEILDETGEGIKKLIKGIFGRKKQKQK